MSGGLDLIDDRQRMARLSTMVVDHSDWFEPVRESTECKYVSWDKERFRFGVEIEAPQAKPLENHPVLAASLWAPVLKLHSEAIRTVVKDVQTSEKRIAAMIAAFEGDQDWSRLLSACRAERDAFAQRAKAALTKAEVKMQAIAARIWAGQSVKDPLLSGAAFSTFTDQTVRPGSVVLKIGEVSVSKGSDLKPWQDAVKACVKASLDLGRQGRVLEKAQAELKAEAEALATRLKAGTTCDETLLNKAAEVLETHRTRVEIVEDAATKAADTVAAARSVSGTVIEDCKVQRALDQLAQTDEDLAALASRVAKVTKTCTAARSLDTAFQSALQEMSGPEGAKATLKALQAVQKSAKSAVNQSAGTWDDLSKIASRAMNAVVNVGKINIRHASQFKTLPGDIDVSVV